MKYKYMSPYQSDKQNAWMHINKPEIAKRWDAEMRPKKKYKISVDNKLKGSMGEMDTETNEIKININAHKKKGKLDKSELASTIKHELMHVKHPKMTEKEVYKRTAKTKIPPNEQKTLLAKLKRSKLPPGGFYNDYQKNKIKRKVNNQSVPLKEKISIMGMA